MAITEIQRAKLGPDWQARTGLKQVGLLDRAYYAHAGSVSFDDIRDIARKLPGYVEKEHLYPGRFEFVMPGGHVAFDFPKFYFGNGGCFTEGATEVHTLSVVRDNEIESLAILLKDGMNGRHTQRPEVVASAPPREKFLELD